MKTPEERVAEIPKIVDYTTGIGRNPGDEHRTAHLYAIHDDGSYLPMCRKGWNRSDGERFSILRGNVGTKGTCKTCEARKAAGLHGVESVPNSHKTKWL